MITSKSKDFYDIKKGGNTLLWVCIRLTWHIMNTKEIFMHVY